LKWGWRRELGSWFQRQGEAYRKERSVMRKEDDVGGRARVTRRVEAMHTVSPFVRHAVRLSWEFRQVFHSEWVSELEFNVPFQHKHGYIRDERPGMESYPYAVTEGQRSILTSTLAAFLFRSHPKKEVVVLFWWIKIPLGMEVGLGPWPHCVRWGPPKGHSPPVFGPCLLWPDGWMDEDATW